LSDSGNLTNFDYNEGEERVKKTDLLSNRSTYYFFDNYEETWENGVKKEAVSYYFANNLRLAQRTVDDTGTEP
ncbi:MAG: hypothetical protein JXR70_03725, partial [Spirochaetales bacterium]|nr:hypothetical protein [Spirochaetales bacterium]